MDIIAKAILEADIYLFYMINESWSNQFLDWLMPKVSDVIYWLPIYAIGLIQLIRKKSWAALTICIFIATIVFLADQTSATLIKPYIERARPCQSIDNINLLVNCGGGKSFPSAHSTNNFAVATFLIGLFPRKKYLWLALAALVAISRVYNGVHYPYDIMGGAALGSAIGWWMYLLYSYTENRFFK